VRAPDRRVCVSIYLSTTDRPFVRSDASFVVVRRRRRRTPKPRRGLTRRFPLLQMKMKMKMKMKMMFLNARAFDFDFKAGKSRIERIDR
jgi:hypothetical protein